MGCDIHFYVEVRKGKNWESADRWSVDPSDGVPYIDDPDKFYSGRNYYLFSILAGVRSYDNAYEPICNPRGLPSGLSKEVEDECERWDVDGHSQSYFTLAELLEIDWQKNENWRNATGRFVLHTLHRMRQLGDPENVRCVFWFDN